MSGTAGDVFFWNDYQGDNELKACSLASQGLWMRFLCIMAQSTKKGFLLIGGKPPSAPDLAKVVGCSIEELKRCRAELEKHNVYSRGDDGVIYCRRMVEKEKHRFNSSKGGRRGGPASLSNKKGIHATREYIGESIPVSQSGTHSSSKKKPSLRSGQPRTSKPKVIYSPGCIQIPDWVPATAWDAFTEMRLAKGSRSPFTANAAKLVISRLERLRDAGEDIGAVLAQTVIEAWDDVYPVKPDRRHVAATVTPLFPGQGEGRKILSIVGEDR